MSHRIVASFVVAVVAVAGTDRPNSSVLRGQFGPVPRRVHDGVPIDVCRGREACGLTGAATGHQTVLMPLAFYKRSDLRKKRI